MGGVEKHRPTVTVLIALTIQLNLVSGLSKEALDKGVSIVELPL